MPSLAQEYTDKRVTAVRNARGLLDKAEAEKRDLTAEETKQFECWIDESKELKAKADAEVEKENQARNRVELLEAEEAALKEAQKRHGVDPKTFRGFMGGIGDDKADTQTDLTNAMSGWFRNSGRSKATEQEVEAANRLGVNINASEVEFKLSPNFNDVRREFYNALSSRKPSEGGVLRPEGFIPRIEIAQLEAGPMLQLAEIIRTTHGNPMTWPTSNDTSNTGRQIGESKSVAEVKPTLAAQKLLAYKMTSDEVLVPFELMRDSGVPLVPIIGDMLGDRLGRIQNTKITLGDGASTVMGVVPSSEAGKTTASATAIAADETIDLKYSVDSRFRRNGSYMAHENIFVAVVKLKDSTGNYIWKESLRSGEPDRLNNSPFYTNADMASSIVASAKTMLFGDFKQVKVRQVGTARFRRLDEKYAESDQVAFLAFIEMDAILLNAGICPIKHLLQKAS